MTAALAKSASLDIPIDAEHLQKQLSSPVGDLQGHYLRRGLSDRLTPTKWFSTDWYAWQNPDWVGYEAPYLHYLERGRFEGRDPSPFVDVARYRQMTGVAPGEVYDLIRAGHRAVSLGVYGGLHDLARCQRRFLDGLSDAPTPRAGYTSGRGMMSGVWWKRRRPVR